MSDIININIGRAGLRIGDHFWKVLHQQHKINSNCPEGLMHFFRETYTGWQARSMFIDLESQETDKIRINSNGLHHQDNIISTDIMTEGTYAEAYYNCFPKIKEEIVDRMQKNIQNCDSFSDGSVGSGVGSRVIGAMRDRYPDKMVHYYRLMPNLHLSTHPINIYNATFTISQDVQYNDLNLFYDNSAIHKQMAREGNFRPTCDQLNKWIGDAIAQTTIPFRFAGTLNTSQRKIATNTVLFPRMHFSTFSVSKRTSNPLVSALAPQNYLLTDYFTACPQKRTFTIHANVCSALANENEVFETVNKQFSRRNYEFVDWMRNITISLNEQPFQNASLIINSYHIKPFFQKMADLFTVSFRRKAFIHRYLAAGMDEMEFIEAESNLNDLVSEYTPPENYAYDYDDENEEIIEEI